MTTETQATETTIDVQGTTIVGDHLGELNETVDAREENPVEAVAGQFGVNVPFFVGQLVNFLIVLLVLWAFVYKPVLQKLQERQEKIEKSVKNAQDIDARLEAVEREQAHILTEAKKQAQQVIEEAQKTGEARRDEIVSAAKKEVERVVTKGKLQLAQEKTEMVRSLRKDIVDIAMKAATRVVQDGIDEKRSQSLSEEIVRKMTQE